MNLKMFVHIGVLIIAIWLVGISLGYITILGLGPLSGALFAISVVAFVGTLRAGGNMRSAMAASFVIVYFALLAALTTSQINRAQIDSAVGLKVWDNFTYLVGVIVVFYFGSTAAVEVADRIYGVSRDAEATTLAQPQPPQDKSSAN